LELTGNESADDAVRLRGVEFGFGRTDLFTGLDLALPRGLTFLVGVNGAGKTTLFRLMLGDLRPSRGTIEIPGLAGTPVRSAIGYLPQSFGFPPRFTVTDFVAHLAWLRGVDRRRRPALVRAAIARVGLTERAGDRMGTLSGGMLRRAGIAQALVHEPPLVLLDEPTVGLDPRQRMDLRDVFRTLATTVTLVVSTHLLEDVAALGGHVAVLHEGRLRFTGSVDEMAAHAGDDQGGGSTLDRAFLALTATEEAVR
jgi:ABC-2 type transport system ATP-binding protein